MNISVIVCTKDRPFDLKRLLNSLVLQKFNFFEILIVDGSDNHVKDVVDEFTTLLPIKYWHLRPPGLTRQRNFGISHLSPESHWVGFLDDDLELEENCVSSLYRYIETHPKVRGVGLRINDQRDMGKSFLREFMLLDRFPGGQVTKAGAAAPIRPYTKSTETEWVYGGATFWNQEILKTFKFDEWFSGVGYCEDLDFSYGVSRHHQLAVCAEAKCYHHHKEPAIQKVPLMGEWLVVAWWYFARVKHSFNPFFVCWGIFWMSLNNLLIGIAKQDKRRILMFKGNLQGWKKIFTGKVQTAVGFQK